MGLRMSISLIGKDATNIASTTNGVPVFTGDAAAAPAGVGGTRMFSENDPGAITGTPYLVSPETSTDYRLRVGLDTILYDHTPAEIALDTSRLKISGIATMTTTLASGFIALNAGAAATASGNYVSYSTNRVFRIRGASQLYVEMEVNVSTMPIANQVFEAGLFLPVAGIQPADGVWFQIDSSGLKGTINYNGTITQTGVLAATLTAGVNYHLTMAISDTEVQWWKDDVLLIETQIPGGQAAPCLTDSLPYTMQMRNSGVVSASGQAIVKVGNIVISAGDLSYNKPFSHQMAGMGHMGYQGQAGGTMGTTALYPNAAAATVVTGAALSQTATLATGLGGQIGITAAVPGVDGYVFAFQNPVGSVSQPPRNLTITGLKISSVNIGAAVATTPSTLAWSLAFGATGATIPSLAATETGTLVAATVKAHRRIPLGLQTWLVGAALGASGGDIVIDLSASPVVLHPGEWVGLVAKFIQGTATATQVIFVNATVLSCFD
jgi:hypothetical protein